MVQDGAIERFHFHRPRVVPALLGVFTFAVGLDEWRDSPSITAAAFLLFGVYIVLGALRQPFIAVDPHGATTGSILRTRRYPFAELQGVDVVRARTGFPSFGREHLVFRRSNGRTRAYRQISAWPPKGDATRSIVRRAAASIDAQLRLSGQPQSESRPR